MIKTDLKNQVGRMWRAGKTGSSPGHINYTIDWIQEYSVRKILYKLGFTDSIDNLTQLQAAYLSLIATEFAKLEAADLRKDIEKAKSRKGRGR